MTCIAAVVDDEGTVYIGGDAAATDEYDFSLGIHTETKVWINQDIVFGACGSFRVSQLLRWHLELPDIESGQDAMSYLSGQLAGSMRTCLEEGGALTTWDSDSTEELTDSGLVIGFRGRVFEMFSDFGVGELIHGYASVGCGSLIALGVLAATEKLKVRPKRRVSLALEAAERHSAGVRGPMTILKLGN